MAIPSPAKPLPSPFRTNAAQSMDSGLQGLRHLLDQPWNEGRFAVETQRLSLLDRCTPSKLFRLLNKPRCPAFPTLPSFRSPAHLRVPDSNPLLPYLRVIHRLHDRGPLLSVYLGNREQSCHQRPPFCFSFERGNCYCSTLHPQRARRYFRGSPPATPVFPSSPDTRTSSAFWYVFGINYGRSNEVTFASIPRR